MIQKSLLILGDSNFSETYFDYMKMPGHIIRKRMSYLKEKEEARKKAEEKTKGRMRI